MTPTRIARATGGKVRARGGPATTLGIDSRALSAGACFVALRGERFDGHVFLADAVARGAAGVVVARNARVDVPEGVFVVEVPDCGRALLDLAAEHRRRHRAKVVGITGSCGKTSVKDMLGQVLAHRFAAVQSPSSFNNQVGVPLSIFQIARDTRFAVIEIGTNAPGEIALLGGIARPDVGIVTCVGEAHLRGLGTLGGVAAEKAALLGALAPDGIAIVNDDDEACRRMADECGRRALRVSLHRDDVDWFATDVHFHGLGTCFRLRGERPVTLPRIGSHNVYNALLSIAAATELGMGLDDAIGALGSVPASHRRLERIALGDVTLFDDTYNMNPASARAGLHALAGLPDGGRRVVVFGEMLELGDECGRLHRELGAEVSRTAVDVLITVGDGSAAIADGAEAAGMPADRVVRADDVGSALEALVGVLRPADVVLCKASRRVGLDRLVDGLVQQFGNGTRVGAAALEAVGGGET